MASHGGGVVLDVVDRAVGVDVGARRGACAYWRAAGLRARIAVEYRFLLVLWG